MKKSTDRRDFIKTSVKAGAIMTLGLSAVGQAFATASEIIVSDKSESDRSTGFEQQPLPYAYDALEPVIDAATMEIHYSKHAATYCKNLNEAVKAESVNLEEPLDKLLGKISHYSTKLRNNAGGHFNHEFFWQSMRPAQKENKPDQMLMEAIDYSFGGFDAMKAAFTDAAKTRFGSGWAWLVINESGGLFIGSTANQDNPLMNIPTVEIKGTPLLGLDVWEHAYYLKYQNKRADYIDQWWSVVNWEKVTDRYLINMLETKQSQ